MAGVPPPPSPPNLDHHLYDRPQDLVDVDQENDIDEMMQGYTTITVDQEQRDHDDQHLFLPFLPSIHQNDLVSSSWRVEGVVGVIRNGPGLDRGWQLLATPKTTNSMFGEGKRGANLGGWTLYRYHSYTILVTSNGIDSSRSPLGVIGRFVNRGNQGVTLIMVPPPF